MFDHIERSRPIERNAIAIRTAIAKCWAVFKQITVGPNQIIDRIIVVNGSLVTIKVMLGDLDIKVINATLEGGGSGDVVPDPAGSHKQSQFIVPITLQTIPEVRASRITDKVGRKLPIDIAAHLLAFNIGNINFIIVVIKLDIGPFIQRNGIF